MWYFYGKVNKFDFKVFAIARFYGWTDDYVLDMASDQFNKAFNYIQILKSQEQLVMFENISYPKMSDRDRKQTFKRVKNVAIPNELNSQKIFSVKDAEKMIRKMQGGK